MTTKINTRFGKTSVRTRQNTTKTARALALSATLAVTFVNAVRRTRTTRTFANPANRRTKGTHIKRSGFALALLLVLATAGCASAKGTTTTSLAESNSASQESVSSAAEQAATQQSDDMGDKQENDSEEDGTGEMRMSIGGTDVSVEWEDNQAVADLMALAADAPITVELSIYGGFEQVGPLGTSLTTSDVQMTTQPGDVVLYAGNQISIFYGQNSWAYTKLGRIVNRTPDEMADLLGNENVSITITVR